MADQAPNPFIRLANMDAIFVMCPQNSFLSPQGSLYLRQKAENLKVRLIDFLSRGPRDKLFFRESHALDDSFFRADKTHSIANTYDFEIVEPLKKYSTIFFDKVRYSAFYETSLELFLKQRSIKSVGLVGVETHTSILFTAEELRNRDYEVTVVEACTAARDDYLHACAVTLLRHYLGVKIS